MKTLKGGVVLVVLALLLPFALASSASPKTAVAGFGQHCEVTVTGKFDPIVFPGQKQMGHRHVFFGPENITPKTTHRSLKATPTTCHFLDGTDGTNHSAYWAPDLKTRFGKWAGLTGASVYYKNGTLSRQSISKMQAFPSGLRLVAHNTPEAEAGWGCTTISGFLNELTKQPRDCPEGQRVTFRMSFPQCGNGSKDSADHESHVVYPAGGKCPASHPEVYPQVIPIVHYDTRFGEGAQLASGDPWTELHSDIFEAWNQDRLQSFIEKCNKALINCRHQP